MTARHVGGALAALPLRRGWGVRAARDEDADGLVALVAAAFDEYDGCVFDPDGLDSDLFAWASALDRDGGTGWVLTDDQGVIGCVGVTPMADDPATVELKRLYVADRARRVGLGVGLVRLVEAWALDHGRTRVVLWSDTRFTDAHRLYVRSGYRRLPVQRHLDDPSDTTESCFERVLR